jgi:hypothetical protein
MLDPILGEIELREDDFSCTVPVDGASVELLVSLDGALLEQALSTARALVVALPSLVARAWDEAAAGCLPLINRGYLQPGEPPLTQADFRRRATLSAISTDADGNVSFDFNDDDMLWGHYVTVNHLLGGAAWDVRMSG